MCASMGEEAEAIGSCMQLISVEPDVEARAIMYDSMGEEFKQFSIELEFLLRRTSMWRETAEGILLRLVTS